MTTADPVVGGDDSEDEADDDKNVVEKVAVDVAVATPVAGVAVVDVVVVSTVSAVDEGVVTSVFFIFLSDLNDSLSIL